MDKHGAISIVINFNQNSTKLTKKLFRIALGLVNGDHARLEHRQQWNVLGKNAEASAERGHIHLLDISGVVEDLGKED